MSERIERRPRRASTSPLVALARQGRYDVDEIEAALEALLEPLGGLTGLIRPGWRVLVKPNLLTGRAPSEHTCSHPAVVEAVLRLVKRAGATATLGDSPAFEGCHTVIARTGLGDVLNRTGATLAPFEEEVTVAPAQDCTFHSFRLAREPFTADGVVNLARLKTHGQMTLTLAVKNLFGCVVGTKKALWHVRAGADPGGLGRFLCDLNSVVAPSLNILDGIVAMEGAGPASGTGRPLGLLAASANAHALDAVTAELAGFRPEQIPTLAAAAARGIPGADPRAVERRQVLGEPFTPVRLRPASRAHLIWLPWAWARRLAQGALAPHPEVDGRSCTGCGACARICPVHAVFMALAPDHGRGRGEAAHARIRHDRCIRCFCCQETCPEGAIGVRDGWVLRCLGSIQKTLFGSR